MSPESDPPRCCPRRSRPKPYTERAITARSGPKIAGVLVAGGVLSWLVFIPLLSSLVPADTIATQLHKLGYLADLAKDGGKGGWNAATHTFADYPAAIYYAFIRQIGAGAVAAGGIITLFKTIPTIVKSI